MRRTLFEIVGHKMRKRPTFCTSYSRVVRPAAVRSAHAPIGVFRKQFKQSLVRSTWVLEQPGLDPITITERSVAIAIFRRLCGLLPHANEIPFFLRFHFDWTSGGRRVGTFNKVTRLRDHYVIEIDEPALDRRLAIAQSVALDALQSR